MSKKRANGEGSIRKRKDGRWEGRMVIGYDDKGLPKMSLPKPRRSASKNFKSSKKRAAG